MFKIAGSCNEWALKSQTAALVAEIIRKEGLSLWEELHLDLASFSKKGPIQAELVSMMLRWLVEDITVHNEDIEGNQLGLLLRGLSSSLPEIFLLLNTLLEKHSKASRQQPDAATVTATLNAINAYAEWAPVCDLENYGIIQRYYVLLDSDFRFYACEFFKLVCRRKTSAKTRKKSAKAVSQCDSSMIQVSRRRFMLGFYKHFNLALHYQSLLFWLALMRDLLPKSRADGTGENVGQKALMRDLLPKSKTDGTGENVGQADTKKKRLLAFVDDDMCNAILDKSFKQVLKKKKGKGEFSLYRSRLLELIRFFASHKPLITVARVSERIITTIDNIIHGRNLAQELVIMESMQFALESVVMEVTDIMEASDESNKFSGSSEDKVSIHKKFKGLLEKLLSVQTTVPAEVELVGHYLDAMGTFWKSDSEVFNHITKKLLELLDSLPSDSEDPSFRHARQQICTSFVQLPKTADALPRINEIYGKISNLQGQGPLVWTEWSILAEAVLVMASAARVEEQHVVLEFFLQHLREQWTNPDSVKAYLSSHTGLVKLCSDPSNMWSVFHMVTFFGKALKSCGLRKRNISSQSTPAADATIVHPMALHLSWMLPTLLKLLRAIHSLWSPLITQALPAKIRAAIEMSDVERTSLLSEGNLKVSKNYSEANETDIQSWLKGIRDRGYNVLGLLTTVWDSFFKCVDSGSIALALMENIESMEFRHTRQLIRSVLIPLVKNCPSDLWDVWLKKLLRPLFVYSQLALAGSSSSQLRDLTRGICSLLSVAASQGVNTGLPRLKHPRLINSMDISSPERFDSFTLSSLVGYILGSEELFNPVSMIMTGAFNWTDGGAVTEILSFCDAAIRLAIFSDYVKLEQFISDKLFLTILHGLTLESNAAMISGDLVGLCHKILVYLSGRNSSPQKILSSLLYITPELLAAFEKEMTKTYSSRKQKQHLRGIIDISHGKIFKSICFSKRVCIVTNGTT